MPLISVVINLDTRTPRNSEAGMFNGVTNADFLTDGVFNKIKFFSGFDIETIVFIDEHNQVDEKILSYLRSICDTVCIRKHTDEHAFNCKNYLNALGLARGEYICHWDGDMAAFTNSKEPIEQMLGWVEDYKFVSYPSHWTPNAVHDPTFQGKMWASTRFFICKRDTIDINVLRKCIDEPNWGYEKFGDSARRCNWLEHFLTLSTGNSVYYPPIEMDKYLIFTWGRYEPYDLRRLNEIPYNEVKEWVISCGGIQYPVDVFC